MCLIPDTEVIKIRVPGPGRLSIKETEPGPTGCGLPAVCSTGPLLVLLIGHRHVSLPMASSAGKLLASLLCVSSNYLIDIRVAISFPVIPPLSPCFLAHLSPTPVSLQSLQTLFFAPPLLSFIFGPGLSSFFGLIFGPIVGHTFCLIFALIFGLIFIFCLVCDPACGIIPCLIFSLIIWFYMVLYLVL